MSDLGEGNVDVGDRSRYYAENLRILLVDDNCVCLQILSQILKICRYQFTTTKKTNEAYEILKENQDSYNLVLTNVKSNGDGFKFAEAVETEFNIAVVFISADDSMASVQKGITIGADYLPKPIRYEDVKLIWKHVAKREHFNTLKLKAGDEKNLCRNPVPRLMERTENTSERELDGIISHVNEKNEKLLLKKQRFNWKPEMHSKFVRAVNQVGIKNAVPMKILELMNEPTLTRENVASHLQKHRKNLETEKENDEKKIREIQNAFSCQQRPSPLPCVNDEVIITRSYGDGNYGLVSCFSGGYNPNGMLTSVRPMPPSSCSYGRNLLGSTHQKPIFHTTNSRVMSTGYGIPNQDPEPSQVFRMPNTKSSTTQMRGSIESAEITHAANFLEALPPSSSHGQLERRDSSETKQQSIDSFNNWDLAILDEMFATSSDDFEDDDGIVALCKNNSAPTLDMIIDDATNVNSRNGAQL